MCFGSTLCVWKSVLFDWMTVNCDCCLSLMIHSNWEADSNLMQDSLASTVSSFLLALVSPFSWKEGSEAVDCFGIRTSASCFLFIRMCLLCWQYHSSRLRDVFLCLPFAPLMLISQLILYSGLTHVPPGSHWSMILSLRRNSWSVTFVSHCYRADF